MEICQPPISHGLLSTNIINLFCTSFLYNFCDSLIYKRFIIHCHLNFHSCGGVRLNTLVPYLLLSLWSIPLLPLQSTSKIYGIMVKRDNRSTRRETWPRAILFTTNLIDWPKIEPRNPPWEAGDSVMQRVVRRRPTVFGVQGKIDMVTKSDTAKIWKLRRIWKKDSVDSNKIYILQNLMYFQKWCIKRKRDIKVSHYFQTVFFIIIKYICTNITQ